MGTERDEQPHTPATAPAAGCSPAKMRISARPRPAAGAPGPPAGTPPRPARAAALDDPNGASSWVLGLLLGWLRLSLVLFLISSHFNRTPLPRDVAAVLDPAGSPLTSANNILVLGSAGARRTAANRALKRPARALGHDHADPHRGRALGAPVDSA